MDLARAKVDSSSGKPWRETSINKEQASTEMIGVGTNKTVVFEPDASRKGKLGGQPDWSAPVDGC
jgi:hypothetical protein